MGLVLVIGLVVSVLIAAVIFLQQMEKPSLLKPNTAGEPDPVLGARKDMELMMIEIKRLYEENLTLIDENAKLKSKIKSLQG